MTEHDERSELDEAEDGSTLAVTDGGAQAFMPLSARERTAVQQAVDRLLHVLAPERAVSRAVAPPEAIERHRTPRGCILQAATGAVSVSWFPDAASGALIGELQVVVWRGTVSRPGSSRRVAGATVVRELVVHPVDGGVAGWGWRDADGAVHDTDALAARCLALLREQTESASPA